MVVLNITQSQSVLVGELYGRADTEIPSADKEPETQRD